MHVPDVVLVQRNRELPDAFTDLLIRQGLPVPSLAPKKWKVWWLTTIALYITVRWVDHFMPYYYNQWGLDETHPRLQSIVSVFVTTFTNSYILTPLLLFLFHPWMKRQECEKDEREPWRTLNDGFQSTWNKGLITFALYGGCAIAWIVKAYGQ